MANRSRRRRLAMKHAEEQAQFSHLLRLAKERRKSQVAVKLESRRLDKRTRVRRWFRIPASFNNYHRLEDSLRYFTRFKPYWIRPLNKWEWPESAHERDLIIQLAQYLFDQYQVPKIMEVAWYRGELTQMKWYIHIAQGQNIRTAPDLPFPLSKRMAHYFYQAPVLETIEQSMRWAQIVSLTQNKSLANQLARPQIAGNVHCEDFWVEMIHFMNRACNGRYENLRRLIHYVRRVKFSRRRMYDRHQGIRYLPPEKPHFSFKGRNWEKLQEEMMQWEDIQARNGQAFKSSLVASIDDFLQEGQLDHQVGSFHIKPLLTEREILEEGRSMSHCVGSYGHLVKAGNTSIWSLSFTKRGHGSPKRLLTLEVSKGHRIIQSKGKANRPPTQLEETLVKKWALQQGLTYASW